MIGRIAKAVLHGATVLLTFSLFFAFGIFLYIACGWVKDVAFGDKTTSQFVGKWNDYRLHPERSPLGRQVEALVERARS